MKKFEYFRIIYPGVLLLTFLLSGCVESEPESPDNDMLSGAIAKLYIDVGGASKVTAQQLLGKHYLPGDNSWQIVSCTELILKDNNTIKDCNDSFVAFKLDSGKWILNGQVNSQYRWVEAVQ